MRVVITLEDNELQLVFAAVDSVQPSHELRQQILEFLRDLSEADEHIRVEQREKESRKENTIRVAKSELDRLHRERAQ